jgi:hypothetical protein
VKKFKWKEKRIRQRQRKVMSKAKIEKNIKMDKQITFLKMAFDTEEI